MLAPTLTLTYQDRPTGIRGYLVVDRLVRGLCAGGLRIRPGVDTAELGRLARAMTYKQAAAGISVGGAKAGIDMAPDHPERSAVLGRFIAALRPMLSQCWVTGPDLDTTIEEIEAVAREHGIPSVKIAISEARGVPRERFLQRAALLGTRVHGWTVNQLRAPAAVAASCMSLARHLGIERPRVAIQGAGHMGRGTAIWLDRAGVPVVAWADRDRCLQDADGLPIDRLSRAIDRGLLPPDGHGDRPESIDRPEIVEADADILVLAAISDAFDVETSARVRCRGIVQAANLALDRSVEDVLHERGVVIVPDALGSVGGSLASEALYTLEELTDGNAILEHVRRRSTGLVDRLLAEAAERGESTRVIVERWIATRLRELDASPSVRE